MARQAINLGTAPSGQDGDDARTAFSKTNANFVELYGGSVLQPANAKLSSIAGIVIAANQMLYATGVNTFESTPLTAFARTLLDDADASTMQNTLGATTTGKALFTAANAAGGRTALGLGTAATADVTTSALDTVAGRIFKLGDYGIGGRNIQLGVEGPDSDLNTGSFDISPAVAWANRPALAQAGWVRLWNQRHNAAIQYQGQIAMNFGAPSRMALRNNFNGTWGAWSEVFTTTNILGTVSQTNGTPAGAIIETGSNSNGTYTKYADGTMICVATITVSIATDLAYLGGFRSAQTQWVFPASFSAVPTIQANPEINSACAGMAGNSAINQTGYFYWSGQNAVAASRTMKLIAIGRWY